MRKDREIWFGYAVNCIKVYPARKAALEELHSMNVTPSYSGGSGSRAPRRATELTAVRELPEGQMQEYEAVRKALEYFKRRGYRDMEKFVSMVYWKKSHTITGAGQKLNLQPSTARRWNYMMKVKVGEGLGRIEDAEEYLRAHR